MSKVSNEITLDQDSFLDNNFILSQKTLIINDSITEEFVGKCIKALLLMDAQKNNKPIKIIINTFGGSLYDGLALYDFIRNLDSEVYTYGYGKIMSMGTFLLLAGDYKFISKRSTIMIHEMSDSLEGQLKEIDIGYKECMRLQNILLDIYCTRTKNNRRAFWKKLKRDTYYTPENALRIGLVDEILGES